MDAVALAMTEPSMFGADVLVLHDVLQEEGKDHLAAAEDDGARAVESPKPVQFLVAVVVAGVDDGRDGDPYTSHATIRIPPLISTTRGGGSAPCGPGKRDVVVALGVQRGQTARR